MLLCAISLIFNAHNGLVLLFCLDFCPDIGPFPTLIREIFIMSVLLNWITAISMVALGTLLFYRDYKARSGKGVILHAVILLACVAFLWRFYGFLKTAPVGKGDNDEVYFIIVLYLLMVLGMLASYAFHGHSFKCESKWLYPRITPKTNNQGQRRCSRIT